MAALADLQRVHNKEAAMSNGHLRKEAVANSGGVVWWILRRLFLRIFIYLLVFALIAFGTSYIPGIAGTIVPCVVVFFALLPFIYFFSQTCCVFDVEYYEVPIREMSAYQDEQLLDACWQRVASQWDQQHDVVDQVIEGYCGYASMNSILSSIYKQRLYLEYPTKGAPLTLQQIQEALTTKVMEDEVVLTDFPNIRIKSINVVVMDPTCVSLKEFEEMIKEIDNNGTEAMVDDNGEKWVLKTYFLANFNRAPMFFCNTGCTKRYWKWLSTGHFSPLLSYCHDANDEMYVLVGDVNHTYGNYLCPTARFYEAMKCRQRSKERRGLLKIVVHFKEPNENDDR